MHAQRNLNSLLGETFYEITETDDGCGHAGLATMCAMAAGTLQTFTGEVSDSMCGAKHMMSGSAACTAPVSAIMP